MTCSDPITPARPAAHSTGRGNRYHSAENGAIKQNIAVMPAIEAVPASLKPAGGCSDRGSSDQDAHADGDSDGQQRALLGLGGNPTQRVSAGPRAHP